MSTLKLIVNPVSGGKQTTRWIPKIENALRQLNLGASIAYTTKSGEGTRLAASAVHDGYEHFGVVGGDGTIHEVVNGLVQANPTGKTVGPLAIFPAGSGNDLAATLMLRSDQERFAHSIRLGKTKPIDICTVSVQTPAGRFKRNFINNLGVGLEGAVAKQYGQVHWVQGHLRYVVAALQTIRAYQPTALSAEWSVPDSVQIDSDLPAYFKSGETPYSGQTMLITVGNNRRAGGGFYLTPDARLDNAMIDVGILASVSKASLLKLLGQALRGKHIRHPAITMLRTPSLSISSEEPLPVQADGELLAMNATRVDVTLHTQSLQVYT